MRKPEVCILPVAGLSTRNLPATKVLHKGFLTLHNKPIIQYVYEAAKKSKLAQEVIVATDDKRIKTAVEKFGGVCEMTRADHQCGSDRIAEIASRHDFNNRRYSFSTQCVFHEQTLRPLSTTSTRFYFSTENTTN